MVDKDAARHSPVIIARSRSSGRGSTVGSADLKQILTDAKILFHIHLHLPLWMDVWIDSASVNS